MLGAVAIIADNTTRSDTALKILNLLLPVIGVWMGTVMAYYFSKENYEAAARHVMQASQPQATASPAIATIMTPYDKMPKTEIPEQADPDQTKLTDLFPKTLLAAMASAEASALPRQALRSARTQGGSSM